MGQHAAHRPVGPAAFDADGRSLLLRYCEYTGLDHGFRDESGRWRFSLVARDVVGWLRDRGLRTEEESSRLLERIPPS